MRTDRSYRAVCETQHYVAGKLTFLIALVVAACLQAGVAHTFVFTEETVGAMHLEHCVIGELAQRPAIDQVIAGRHGIVAYAKRLAPQAYLKRRTGTACTEHFGT